MMRVACVPQNDWNGPLLSPMHVLHSVAKRGPNPTTSVSLLRSATSPYMHASVVFQVPFSQLGERFSWQPESLRRSISCVLGRDYAERPRDQRVKQWWSETFIRHCRWHWYLYSLLCFGTQRHKPCIEARYGSCFFSMEQVVVLLVAHLAWSIL